MPHAALEERSLKAPPIKIPKKSHCSGWLLDYFFFKLEVFAGVRERKRKKVSLLRLTIDKIVKEVADDDSVRAGVRVDVIFGLFFFEFRIDIDRSRLLVSKVREFLRKVETDQLTEDLDGDRHEEPSNRCSAPASSNTTLGISSPLVCDKVGALVEHQEEGAAEKSACCKSVQDSGHTFGVLNSLAREEGHADDRREIGDEGGDENDEIIICVLVVVVVFMFVFVVFIPCMFLVLILARENTSERS